MGIVSAKEEENDWDAGQELLGRCVLRAIVDLFPHVQVVVRSAVEVKWHTTDIVEHDIRAHHVGDVGQGP